MVSKYEYDAVGNRLKKVYALNRYLTSGVKELSSQLEYDTIEYEYGIWGQTPILLAENGDRHQFY